MHNPIDRSLKLKPIFLLLSLSLHGSAWAVGLGELVLRSHLGQPLNATIALLDAPQGLAADCFSLSRDGGARLPSAGDARISLERKGGGTHLVITTSHAINDPVLQFAIAAECRGSLRRDYVVLLDPPSLNLDSAVVPGGRGFPPYGDESREDSRVKAHPSPHPYAEENLVQPASKEARAHAARTRATVGKSPRPRLILSGKPHLQAGAVDAFAAAQKDMTQADAALPPQRAPTTTELSDETTALAHRLDNLELQLAALRKRNAELEILLKAPPPAPAEAINPDQPQHLSLYLLGLNVLTGGAALSLWLRRRQAPRTPEADNQQWAMTMVSDDELSQTPAAETPRSPLTAARKTPVPAVPKPRYEEGTEVNEGVIDQAEVFVAHGHAEFAIHLLQEHLRDAPAESPVPWLLLLDLLRRNDNEADYNAARSDCQRHFNIQIPPLTAPQSASGKGLEAYPHVLVQLEAVWRTAELDAFLHDLIYDHRGGTRLGFEPAAYRDILMLRAIAQETANAQGTALPIAASLQIAA
jgi:Tfp pilus assembly protein FimV